MERPWKVTEAVRSGQRLVKDVSQVHRPICPAFRGLRMYLHELRHDDRALFSGSATILLWVPDIQPR